MFDEDEMKEFQHNKRIFSEATTKVCKTCGKKKLLSEMGVDSRGKDGLKPNCRMCDNEKRRIAWNKKKNIETEIKRDYMSTESVMRRTLSIRWA